MQASPDHRRHLRKNSCNSQGIAINQKGGPLLRPRLLLRWVSRCPPRCTCTQRQQPSQPLLPLATPSPLALLPG
jgi:hypothetical protein